MVRYTNAHIFIIVVIMVHYTLYFSIFDDLIVILIGLTL